MLFDRALAKINLTLDILGKLPNGYHEMKMVMQSVSLFDGVTITPTHSGDVFVKSGLHFLPTGQKNLASIATYAFYEQLGRPVDSLEILLDKHIPVCAGLAGGSSDAAAVLRLLNERENQPFSLAQLLEIGAKVGSDVPYCVLGGTALAEGVGTTLTPLDSLPPCYIVLCKPNFPISTPELFSKIDQKKIPYRPDTNGMLSAIKTQDIKEVGHRLFNVFEQVLPPKHHEIIMQIKSNLLDCGALGACMSGTGPTVFGIFSEEALAQKACDLLSEQFKEVFLTTPV